MPARLGGASVIPARLGGAGRGPGAIDQTGERGHGLAIAGIIVGVITLLFVIGYWMFIAQHFGGGHGTPCPPGRAPRR